MSKRILMVDDDVDFLEVTASFLKDKGYEIDFVSDPRQAVKEAKGKDYDLIILDISMPEMNGYEVCEILKEEDDTFDIPVLFLTGMKGAGDMLRGFFSGAHDYITKPVEIKLLIEKVQALTIA